MTVVCECTQPRDKEVVNISNSFLPLYIAAKLCFIVLAFEISCFTVKVTPTTSSSK